jgi:hypothetical protein
MGRALLALAVAVLCTASYAPPAPPPTGRPARPRPSSVATRSSSFSPTGLCDSTRRAGPWRSSYSRGRKIWRRGAHWGWASFPSPSRDGAPDVRLALSAGI